MVIQWSDEDQAYLVSFPEWESYVAQPATDGETYEEAARKGHEALLNLTATATIEGVPLPEQRVRVT
jgi:predicted RNase H-like HicB family nuclease